MMDTWSDIRLKDLDIDVPKWIDQDIDCATVSAIDQGGCASGAYMPAVTYHEAVATMSDYGDDVLDYIEDALGCWPDIPVRTSWSGIAVHYLSTAVELWASGASDDLDDALEERGEDEEE